MQLAVKGWFNDMLSQELRNLSPAERIILDTGDGAEISFMSDPEDALFVANNLLVSLSGDLYPGLELRIGINLGSVKVVTDINGRPNIIGDGMNSSQNVMGFASPNQILVSRSYYEVVSCLSDEYARLFGKEIKRRDSAGREHHVYEVRNSRLTAPAAPGADAGQPPTVSNQETGTALTAPDTEPELDARVLAILPEGLAKHLGLTAPLVIKKTARKTRDHQELVLMLADSIPIPQERSAFVREMSSALVTSPKPEMPMQAASATANGGRGNGQVGFSRNALAHVEAMLTAHIGPMAKILVSKAAKTAQSPDDLIAALACSIEIEQARSEFFAAAKKTLGAR
jgi:hypothetical protein